MWEKGCIRGNEQRVNKECLLAVLTGNAMQGSGERAGRLRRGVGGEGENNYDLI